MLLISIEDANGVRLGAGPITTATGWRHHGELNRAGSFTFTMPAADPKASLVRAFRWARAWAADASGLREVGRGRIIQRRRVLGPDGVPMLEVSGPDQVDELADRIVLRADLHDERLMHPVDVRFGDSARQSLLLDLEIGDTSTFVTRSSVGLTFIRNRDKFSLIYVTVHGAQVHDAWGAIYYTTSSGRKTLTVLEETHSDPAPNNTRIWFAHSGYIRFDPPDDWAPPDGTYYYEIQIDMPPPYAWSDVYIGGVLGPTAQAVDQIMAYVPGWSLDTANGYEGTQPRVLSGVELLENTSFETHGGTADDNVTDSWPGWMTAYIEDGNGNSALASTTAHQGGKAVKLTHGTNLTWAKIYTDVPVLPATVYTLTFWTRADGVGQLAYYILDGVLRVIETVDCGVTGTDWVQCRRTFTTFPTSSVITILFVAPIADNSAAWVDDVSLQAGGDDALYLQMAEESALESLIRVMEITGEKFTASLLDRQLLLLGRDARSSGLRAVAYADPIAVRTADDVLLIVDADELEDAEDLVSRVYLYGAGTGTKRLRPDMATLEPPDGYVLNKALGYIERTAAVAAIGVIECCQQWDDIVPTQNGVANDQAKVQAANQLVMQGTTYLEQHSCTDTDPETGDVPKFYHLSVAKTTRPILPGYTVYVRYSHWRDGVRAWAIDRELWITGVDREVAPDGSLVTVGLDVATVPRPPRTTQQLQLSELRRMRGVRGHTVSEGC